MGGEVHYRAGDDLRLGRVRGRAAALEVATRGVVEAQAQVFGVPPGAGDHLELRVVKLAVAHGDQRRVDTAVMPLEHRVGHALGGAEAEDRLEVAGVQVGVERLVVADDHRVEKPRRRQLLVVADDDELPAAGDGPERVDRANLRGFVHEHQVKPQAAGLEVLRDRHRAHHEDGLDRLHRGAGLFEQHPQRQVPTLLLKLPPQHADLADRPAAARQRPVVGCGDLPPGQLQPLGIELTEAGEGPFVLIAGEARQLRPVGEAFPQQCFEAGHRVGRLGRGRGELAGVQPVDDRIEAGLACGFAPAAVLRPLRQPVRVGRPRLQPPCREAQRHVVGLVHPERFGEVEIQRRHGSVPRPAGAGQRRLSLIRRGGERLGVVDLREHRPAPLRVAPLLVAAVPAVDLAQRFEVRRFAPPAIAEGVPADRVVALDGFAGLLRFEDLIKQPQPIFEGFGRRADQHRGELPLGLAIRPVEPAQPRPAVRREIEAGLRELGRPRRFVDPAVELLADGGEGQALLDHLGHGRALLRPDVVGDRRGVHRRRGREAAGLIDPDHDVIRRRPVIDF